MIDIHQLSDFLDASPTPYHAAQEMLDMLVDAGFVLLDEKHSWNLLAGGKYAVCRDNASVIAFVVGELPVNLAGFRLVGAHTDSPCLRVKSQPVINKTQCSTTQLSIETYGGVLTHTWFDRDLCLAGKVSYVNTMGERAHCLLNINDAIAVIPSLAIHLNREANTSSTVNAQEHLPPILGCDVFEDNAEFETWLLKHVQTHDETAEGVLAFDLRFYPAQGAAVIGEDKSLLASARLDNLLSCYMGLQALLDYPGGERTAVLVCTDHEEVGSVSYSGAQGPFLEQVLSRIAGDQLQQALANSVLMSVDNAHAIHPNYSAKHDGNHAPVINGGPVLKLNANQRYASDSESSAMVVWLAQQEGIALQQFIMRADMGCGSTIGPITAANVGIRTVDIGVPQWAMHSARETAGIDDIEAMTRLLSAFYHFD